MDNLSGNDIKGYELRERIGTGGFGAVYRAYQTTVGREVAIKFILPGFASQPDFIRRFEIEAQLVARLEHPHITPLYDYWRDPDGAYLVMRWLRGGSLRETLQNGSYDLRSTALLLDQISSALSLAHRSGVIHRDLKPGNILLDEDGNAYLADFGIAKDLKLKGDNHTQPDAIVGSLDYISPEQARSEPVTPRTDIYSLGVMLYELLTGHHPFVNMSAVERLYKHINDPLPDITGLDASVESSINEIIQKATAKNPDNRYADALALAVEFREAAGLNRTPTGQIVEALLTPREHEILRLIIEGRSNKEIAQHLTVTLGTVKWYVNQIYGKLHVRSRVQAIIRARELNLIGGTIADQAAEVISSVSNVAEIENPYKGLRAFQAADEQDFFGRTDLIEKLIKRMGEGGANPHTRFLAIVGPSGSGKSSLVKAGLIPALWRGDLRGSEKWFVAEMLPGAHPLDRLEVALMRVAANQASNLNEQLSRDERGLLRASDLILPNDGSELVLVIDQFEEVFTLVSDESERQHFLNLLVAAVTDVRSRVRVVVTLRADFYDRPLYYPELGELVRSSLETVMPLSAKGLERAIAGPAERVGIRFESGLVAAMVSEMNFQSGALPLLQYALTELFEHREGRLLTHKAYQEIGGAVGALAKRAEALYGDLTPEGQEAARQMFLRLVTLGEGAEDTRRRAGRSELLAITSNVELMDEMIDLYAGERLLSLDNDPATRAPTVELAHEAILREWERLRGWLNDNRTDIRLQRQLASLAAEWGRAKQEPSYLLHGGRLEIFEKWQLQTELALTPAEQTYLQNSLTQRQKEQADEQQREERETRLERRSVTFLRVLVAVLLLATLGAFLLTGTAVRSANDAQANFTRAEENSNYARSIALASAAKSAQLSNNPDQAIALALVANTSVDNPPAFAQNALYQTAFVTATRRVLHTNSAGGALVTPDGQSIMTWLSDEGDNTALTFWDIASDQILREIPALRAGNSIDADPIFAPDGKTIFVATMIPDFTAGDISQFDFATGREIQRFVLPNGLSAIPPLALSSDGKTLLTASGGMSDGSFVEGPVYVWNVADGTVITQFENPAPAPAFEHAYGTPSMTFSPDGRQAFIAYNNGWAILWDVNTGAAVHTFEGLIGSPVGAYYTTEGLVTITSDFLDTYRTTLTLWDAQTWERIREHTWSTGTNDVSLSSDSRRIALGFVAPYIEVFDLQSWKTTHELYGHGTALTAVAFTPDGHGLISASFDGNPRLWNLDNGSEIIRMEGLTTFLSGLILSPDGHAILSQEYNGPLALWDIKTGKVIRQLGETHSSFMGTAFSPDGRYIVSGTSSDQGPCPSPDGKLTLTDAATGEIVWQVDTEGYAITGKAFINNGSQIATVDWLCGGDVAIWDTATGNQVTKWTGHTDTVWDIVASPDGKMVATVSNDKTAIIWDTATGTILHTLQHGDGLSKVAFSTDGHQLLTADVTGILHLWDVTSGEEVQQFIGSARMVFMQFSPNGRYLVSSSSDSNIYVWDLQTGEVVRQFSFPVISPLGSAVAFSPDSKSLFMTDENNIIHQMDLMLEPGEILKWIAANRYVRDLTCTERALYRVEPLCTSELQQ